MRVGQDRMRGCLEGGRKAPSVQQGVGRCLSPRAGTLGNSVQRLGCRTVEGADLPALHAGELLPVSVHPLQHLGPLRGDLVTGALHSTDLATQNHHPPGCPSSGASAEGSDDRPLQKEPGRVWGHLGGDLGRTL